MLSVLTIIKINYVYPIDSKCLKNLIPIISIKKIHGSRHLDGSVEHLTIDFSSDHDPRVMGSSPTSGSVLNVEPA